jgi:hypothetical protein
MQIYAVITSTKLVMKLKLVYLESGSSPLSNDAISVSIRCIVCEIFAFKTTPLKNDTFQPDENELRAKCLRESVLVVLTPVYRYLTCVHVLSLPVYRYYLSEQH